MKVFYDAFTVNTFREIFITFIFLLVTLSGQLRDGKCFSFLISQQTLTCSNSTIETLEKGVKYVQSLQYFNFIVNFEHILRIFRTCLISYPFTINYLHSKIYILLENILEKPISYHYVCIILRLHYFAFLLKFFCAVICNLLMKHQHPYIFALVLQTTYFDPT